MAPITWQNINAPDFRTSVAALAGAQKSMDSAGTALQQVIADQQKMNLSNWDNQAELNTADILAMQKKIQGLAEFKNREGDFDADALRNQFGVQYNQEKVDQFKTQLQGKLRDKASAGAALFADGVAGTTKSKAQAADAHYQNLLSQDMDPTEAARRTAEYVQSGLMLKDMAWNEQTRMNTQEFINSLAGQEFDPNNTTALEKAATERYGNLFDMGQFRDYMGDHAAGIDRVDNKAHRERMYNEQVKNTAINQGIREAQVEANKLAAEEAAIAKQEANYQKRYDQFYKITDSEFRSKEKDDNRGFWTGWYKPNMSEGEIQAGIHQEVLRRMADEDNRLGRGGPALSPDELVSEYGPNGEILNEDTESAPTPSQAAAKITQADTNIPAPPPKLNARQKSLITPDTPPADAAQVIIDSVKKPTSGGSNDPGLEFLKEDAASKFRLVGIIKNLFKNFNTDKFTLGDDVNNAPANWTKAEAKKIGVAIRVNKLTHDLQIGEITEEQFKKQYSDIVGEK